MTYEARPSSLFWHCDLAHGSQCHPGVAQTPLHHDGAVAGENMGEWHGDLAHEITVPLRFGPATFPLSQRGSWVKPDWYCNPVHQLAVPGAGPSPMQQEPQLQVECGARLLCHPCLLSAPGTMNICLRPHKPSRTFPEALWYVRTHHLGNSGLGHLTGM